MLQIKRENARKQKKNFIMAEIFGATVFKKWQCSLKGYWMIFKASLISRVEMSSRSQHEALNPVLPNEGSLHNSLGGFKQLAEQGSVTEFMLFRSILGLCTTLVRDLLLFLMSSFNQDTEEGWEGDRRNTFTRATINIMDTKKWV